MDDGHGRSNSLGQIWFCSVVNIISELSRKRVKEASRKCHDFFLSEQAPTRKKVWNMEISPKPSKEEFSKIILYGAVDFFQNY